MVEHRVIEISQASCYLEKDVFHPQAVEMIHFQTNVGEYFLQVNHDTDELFWSTVFNNIDDYILSQTQLDIAGCKIINYWQMINHMGYDDAIQIELKDTDDYLFIQFIAIASNIKCKKFK